MAFIVGDVVIHKASGAKGVIVEDLGGDVYKVDMDFGKCCQCSGDALENDDEQ
jgi:hypothetical protein